MKVNAIYLLASAMIMTDKDNHLVVQKKKLIISTNMYFNSLMNGVYVLKCIFLNIHNSKSFPFKLLFKFVKYTFEIIPQILN